MSQHRELSQTWTTEKLYFDGDEYFASVVKAIDSARKEIDLETYIFNSDEMGRWLEQRLIAAAHRGVRVRLLVDGIGASSWIGAWSKEFLKSGIELRIWNPLYVGPFLYGVVRFLLRRRGAARFFSRLNRRTHRKYVIIDRHRAFSGSLNVAREHLKKFSGNRAWRDTGIEVEGVEVRHIRFAFNYAWDRAYTLSGRRRWFFRRRRPKHPTESLVRLNLTRRNRHRFWRDLLNRLRSAQSRVWITNPYLAPTNSLVKALRESRRRGADVRLLVPAQSDVFFMKWVAIAYYGALLRSGVRIFEYQPRFLHAKSILIDDWAMVGTSNLNTRSFLHDLEIDIVVSARSSRDQLTNQFELDLKHAREITTRDWQGRFWVSRLGRLLSFWFRNWI